MAQEVDLDWIAEHWAVERASDATPMGGGYHTSLVRWGNFVVRVEERPLTSVEWEHELVAWLGEAIPEVIVPLVAPDGSTFLLDRDQVVSLLPYVEGQHERVDTAGLLARLHQRGSEWPGVRPRPGRPSYADLEWERNDWWDWSVVPKLPGLVEAFEELRAWVASRPPLFEAPIHGDFGVENVLVRSGRVVAVFDWEYARIEWAALEVGAAAMRFSPEDPSRFALRYADAGGPGELTALSYGVRMWLLANCLYSLTSAAKGKPWSQEWVDFTLGKLRDMSR
jgi:hypothetical protein